MGSYRTGTVDHLSYNFFVMELVVEWPVISASFPFETLVLLSQFTKLGLMVGKKLSGDDVASFYDQPFLLKHNTVSCRSQKEDGCFIRHPPMLPSVQPLLQKLIQNGLRGFRSTTNTRYAPCLFLYFLLSVGTLLYCVNYISTTPTQRVGKPTLPTGNGWLMMLMRATQITEKTSVSGHDIIIKSIQSWKRDLYSMNGNTARKARH
ncbi:hypothetical protein OPV22_016673 [Ensete ventricosum]|uniref:Uncharacterized protein n=1 Tax=Ensete ventricosum TaxID=4639 RepID=A0AAV8R0H1_ENSVE|nr:hypothetical protein OPV22_016673 [Ensete ventricosum]